MCRTHLKTEGGAWQRNSNSQKILLQPRIFWRFKMKCSATTFAILIHLKPRRRRIERKFYNSTFRRRRDCLLLPRKRVRKSWSVILRPNATIMPIISAMRLLDLCASVISFSLLLFPPHSIYSAIERRRLRRTYLSLPLQLCVYTFYCVSHNHSTRGWFCAYRKNLFTKNSAFRGTILMRRNLLVEFMDQRLWTRNKTMESRRRQRQQQRQRHRHGRTRLLGPKM